jgi:flagellar basal-body rod protein FlgG
MNVSLYQAAAAMNANARWQEVISDNLSSASIPGFKKQELSFSEIQAGLMPHAANGSRFTLPSTASFTNFTSGELSPTGIDTNVALDGPGFFEVQLPNGDHGFTRDGTFRLNAQGQLITSQGYLVLGENGPIQLDPGIKSPLVIAPNGEVSQGSDQKGTLKIANFSNPKLLTPISGSLFEARDPNLIPDTTKGSVRQGFMEEGNTSPTVEMGNLILAMRSFEANQRVVQMQGERMGKMISELGNPTA